MWFWNRVEIYCGYSSKEFYELRDVLAAKKIRYDYRIVNNAGRNNSRKISFGVNPKYQYLYYLYVHQKDYDEAMFLTSNRNS
jgi:hypothetical protein